MVYIIWLAHRHATTTRRAAGSDELRFLDTLEGEISDLEA
jgi:hypothetical protein